MNIDTSRLHELAISDTGFVFDPTTGHTFSVNPTGLVVLRALKEGVDPNGVRDRILNAFEPEAHEDLARDIGDFISNLKEMGLVR